MRPKRLFIRSPASPHQLPFIASLSVGLFTIAGVQSSVWILAISALFASRALSYSCWSDQVGYSARIRSAIALCSIVKSTCNA